MERTDRLALDLLRLTQSQPPSQRTAQSLESGDSTDVERGWSESPRESDEDRTSLFEDDDFDDAGDLDLTDNDQQVGSETLRKTRLKLLAGMIWASLGEPTAIVEEASPNELSVRVQDLSWRVFMEEDGRVTISGFDSGSEQFVGQLPESDAERAIIKISDNIHHLISSDIDSRSEPDEPPVHFGPDETPGESTPEVNPADQNPAAPTGDQGFNPESNALPPDLPPMAAPGTAAPQAPMAAPGAGIPQQPMAAPGAMVPGAVPPQQQPGATPPLASRRLRSQRRKREATARLDGVSNQLRRLGESLGEDGDRVFGVIADRVDRVLKLMEQTYQ